MNSTKKVILALLILLSIAGCFKQADLKDTYEIAVIAPLSATDPALGASIIHGAELAVKETNDQGGINGKKITLIKEDDGGLISEGSFFAYRLTRTHMLLGVIGHLDSDISIPASEFYSHAKIPQISPGSTNPYFTERESVRGYVFRTIGRDDMQAKLLADYVIKQGYKRVAITYSDRKYGRYLSGEITKLLKDKPESGVSIVFYSKIERGKTDYGATLSELYFTKPDVLIHAGEYNDAGYIIKDFPKYGLTNTKFIGSDGVSHREFIEIADKQAEGAIVASAPPIQDKAFIVRYKKHFNHEPSGYSANTYDATNILINAIKETKDQDPEQIAMVIANTKNFKGATGIISFNQKGDLTSHGFVLTKVINGKFEVIKQ